MVLLFISCCNPQGEYQDCSFGGDDIETCFEVLSELAHSDYQLISVSLSEYPNSSIGLPVEAFDGQPMRRHLQLLQREWEEILSQN